MTALKPQPPPDIIKSPIVAEFFYIEALREDEYLEEDDDIWSYDPFIPFEDLPQEGDELGFDDLSKWAVPENWGTDDPQEPADVSISGDEPDEPDESEVDAPDSKGGDLSIDSIVGTYYNSGNSYTRKSDDEWEEVPADLYLEVSKVSDTQIDIMYSETGKNMPEPLNYDPSTGIATVTYDPGEIVKPATYTAEFTDLGLGRYAVHFYMDWAGPFADINAEKG